MEKHIKEVDINEYLPVLIDIVNSGKDVSLLISGNSMSPFLIHHRDSIIISKPDKPFKRGDMVFFQRLTGQYVMHRIHHIDKKGKLYIVGDNQTVIEGPVDSKQVFGIINKVIRKGKVLEKKNFWWFFFEKIWIRVIPLRRMIQRMYTYIKNIRK
ncbi:S24/S26 family peptidase [Thomasclavelia sp.]|uniref:S24/S26 family peptidase n=1 Tax=Thomasclavelia sp. TaxID=3025757 RepID=UPI0025F96E98|nr:S24/S26 family peptidase [Thomasclavelia sp.]